MSYNQGYKTRRSGGRYNTGGQFVAAGELYEGSAQRGNTGTPYGIQSTQQQPYNPNNQIKQQNLSQVQNNSVNNDQSLNSFNTTIEEPMVEDDFEMKNENEEDAEGAAAHPHWMKSKLKGVKKISNKERRRRKNKQLRRLLTPKNALMVLNEMSKDDLNLDQCVVEPVTGGPQYSGEKQPHFCATITIDQQNYQGYGETKMGARNAAAEQAIRDLIIKRLSASDAEETGAPKSEEEEPALPMIQLASYALHRLFAEWEALGFSVPQLRPPSQAQLAAAEQLAALPPAQPAAAAPKKPKDKKLPLNAAALHPCVLLTYMRGAYDCVLAGDTGHFTATLSLDDELFTATAVTKKESRRSVAQMACEKLYGVVFEPLAAENKPQPAP